MENLERKVFESFDQLLPHPTQTLVVGVSGGADSLALTLLTKLYAHSKGYGLQTVTIDHQLRPESAAEAQWVGQTLRSLEIAHQTVVWSHACDLNRHHERARTARYQLLLDFCQTQLDPVLLTAHHQQDQVETILMRLLKGSGPAGVQGIQASRCQAGVAIVRPLLAVTPEALRGYLKAKGLAWVEDPSNHDAAYERTRVRQLLAHLGELGWDQTGLLASAAKIYGLHQAFTNLAAEHAHSFVITTAPLIIDQTAFLASPESVQRNWLRQQIWQIGRADYPKPDTTITAILKMLQQPKVNGYRVAGCLIKVIKRQILLTQVDEPALQQFL